MEKIWGSIKKKRMTARLLASKSSQAVELATDINKHWTRTTVLDVYDGFHHTILGITMCQGV